MGIFRSGMSKTRQSFFGRIANMLGGSSIDDETWDDVEALLIQADVGPKVAAEVVAQLRNKTQREGLKTREQVNEALRSVLMGMLKVPPPMDVSGRELSIVLVVGVNGAGKTTSIGKLAKRLGSYPGRRVMLAAGDTFRAAAIEQLQRWGERVNVPVIAGKPGSDPAALVYDATSAAKARGYNILIVDTAGRLHNNFNLMDELAKIKSVSGRVVDGAPHETLLVLDGTTGQNALQQARKFQEMIDVTGVIVTKLDGTAKGGMVFSVFSDLNLPVHYVGLGEGENDLILFSPENFVDSLIEDSSSGN